jgi:hypothetical protein
VPQGMSVQHSCSAGGMTQAANRDTAAHRVQTFGGMRLVTTGTTRAKHSVCNTRLQNASMGRREIRGTPGGGSNFTVYQKTDTTLIPQVAPPWSCSGLKPASSLCSAWCFCARCYYLCLRGVCTHDDLRRLHARPSMQRASPLGLLSTAARRAADSQPTWQACLRIVIVLAATACNSHNTGCPFRQLPATDLLYNHQSAAQTLAAPVSRLLMRLPLGGGLCNTASATAGRQCMHQP